MKNKAKTNKKRVFVGMSGGVDSSVAAFLLKQQGYDVTGVYMRCYNLDGCSEQDAEDARRVAEQLQIPFYIFDFEKEYKREVVKYMIEGYKKGITPNPDVMCNKEIKFGLFLKKARALGADYIATGHYVRRIVISQHRTLIRSSDGLSATLSSRRSAFGGAKLAKIPRVVAQSQSSSFGLYGLFSAKDKNKDQSYFLWTLTQQQLKYCLFPIGDYLKSEVRAMAKKAGLLTASKKDSQGICFLGQVSMEDFLKTYIPEKKGIVISPEGKIIGEHRGAQFYTIGQRHGFTIQEKKSEKQKQQDTKPHYVVEKDIKKNILVVAEEENNETLSKKEVILKNVHFIQPFALSHKPLAILARIRYRQPLVPAHLIKKGNQYKLIFQKPVRFIASGQSAVFYLPVDLSAVASAKAEASAKSGDKKGEMLGGGIIQ